MNNFKYTKPYNSNLYQNKTVYMYNWFGPNKAVLSID